ncbi:MAG: valine--tRNA ligase [Thermodesulfovibrionia bacterium]
MIDKAYNPADIEERWYDHWLRGDYFKAHSKSERQPYCIVIPPPNITGSLHIGHALDITLQDILIRWKRMSGFNTLWLPGTDHAGIATQNVVERELQKQGLSRHSLGRDEFIKRVWQWKERYGGEIIRQLKSMGASCDWSRERFTLDEGLSRAVREVFVRLYNEGLIYRGDYIINWCPRCHTALSDLEVEHEEIDGKLYYIRYHFVDGGGYITVATTRPETLLGDTAVAVNPDDERYRDMVGKRVILPILHRHIPIIYDPYVDSGFGTGAVKITPAHDPNDFEIAMRHGLPFIKIMDGEAKMTDEAGPYKGQDRFECRRNIIRDLETTGELERVEPYKLGLGHCYRCKTVVEPYLSKQWFVRIKPLAEEAIKAVSDGRIRIIPSGWKNSYFDWMSNIKDWCISRQIWWGHRIPVWYCKEMQDDKCKMREGVIVSREEPKECPYCGTKELIQDEDVLDTWFSSALWPFSTLGWPDETEDLKTFYPTSVLVTGFDILFFWVARMIMMGLKFMNKEPFKDVYIHALIRDEEGQKMSKSKGNVIDPLEMTRRYGTDAFRFTLTAYAAQGRDIKFSEKRVEGYRHFINKIWNVARFISMNTHDGLVKPMDIASLTLPNRWVVGRLKAVIEETNRSLEEYRFNESADCLYQFVWHELCDWYLEMIKIDLYGDDEIKKRDAISTLNYVFEITLSLLHPFMPFVTEELWQRLSYNTDLPSLCIRPYPRPDEAVTTDEDAMRMMGFVMDAITGIRSIRGEFNIEPSIEVKAIIRTDAETERVLIENIAYIKRLAKAKEIEIGYDLTPPEGSASFIKPSMEVFVPLEELFDISAEIERIKKERERLTERLMMIERKLLNQDFLKKAPRDVVEENKANFLEIRDKIQRLDNNLRKLMRMRQG